MSGLPIVFVPGLLCTGRIYAHQAEHLGERHPVVLANHWSAATMEEIAAQILDVAPERFALVGTSMGGYVALEIMRRAPARVARLVLMSTSAKPDKPERSEGRRQQVAAARSTGLRAATKALWPMLVHQARHEDLPLLGMFIDMAEQLGVDAFARQIEAIIARADSRPLLSQIAVPTLVVVGKDDTLIPTDDSREMAAGIKGARLEEIPHCGHMTMVEKPETVTRLLRAFLD
ncbi:MAG: alpha/beta fold hydrolase [Alphaproteobacteria bacterium]|nr:alpha/beta fold hydrolase [Alphaproteobacteria bacterium]